MVTYIGPLLLVLLGAGGLVVVFGRRLPDGKAHLAVVGKALQDAASVGAVRTPSMRGRLLRRLHLMLRGIGKVLVMVGRVVARLLQRPPVILRVPHIAFPFHRGSAPPRPTPLRRRSARVSAQRFDTHRSPPEPLPTVATLSDRPVSLVRLPSALQDLSGTVESSPRTSGEDAPTSTQDDIMGPALQDEIEPTPLRLPDFAKASPGRPGFAEQVPSPAFATASHFAPGASRDRPAGRPADEVSTASTHQPQLGNETGQEVRLLPDNSQAPPKKPVTAPPQSRERNGGKRKATTRVRRERGPHIPEMEASGLEEAAKLLKEGQLVRAEAVLVDALAENPRDLNTYRLLGQFYLQRNDFVQAREVLEEALRRDPQEGAPYGLLGRTYFGLSEYGKALQMYQRAHDTDEGNLEYLERLLFIASRMDRRPLVKVTAEKILALEPNHAEAKKQLAKVTAVTV